MKDGLSKATKQRLEAGVFSAFARFIESKELLQGIAHVDLAFSGGADSVALLVLFVRYREAFDLPLSLRVHHIRHGLRSEDWRDADLAEALSERFGLEYLCTELNLGESLEGNVEGKAREARFLALVGAGKTLIASRALDAEAFAIAFGHHGDDNVETALWRLGRGCGIEGLTLAWRRKLYGLNCLRPLLQLSKTELYDFLEHESVPWIEDPSNASERFLRNRIRHRLLDEVKACASSPRRLYASLLQLRSDADAMTSLCQSFLAQQRFWQDSCFCRWEAFDLLSLGAQSQILRQLARRLVPQHLTRADFIAKALCVLRQKDQKHRIANDGRICFAWSRDGFLAWREGSEISVKEFELGLPSYQLDVWGLCRLTAQMASYVELPANDVHQIYIDAADMVWPLRLLGAAQIGIMQGDSAEIDLGEALRSQGIPAHWRKAWPVLCDALGPLWILGGARSVRAKRPKANALALSLGLEN